MAPTPSSKPNLMMHTPSSKSNSIHHQSRTPQSKHRINFNISKPSPNPNSSAMAKETSNPPAAEHPVEVIGRIRDYPDQKKNPISASSLQINPDRQSLRVKTDIGYRDFSLDGVSFSEEDDLDTFYKKFVESRINGVKLGDKCTIMMYGPTGAGKSHTMFGCSKQPGIVYRSLKDILGEGEELSQESGEKVRPVTFVQVTVLEIYNEEIYDLLSTNNGGGFSLGWPKGGCASKVRLEVMGKKAKNAAFIAGHEATKISREIQKVEKRRIVKSTLCNERSSRSHCMIILDVPTVGGRLMLVDMAGSENIEQAGQNGLEAKLQTAKINQGNIALKRVVESIANGDSHVPFRDSKLTMLLQDSFEDDKSKILMILCASPDPKELHKTISTLEYGAKAKCIVRGPHTPINEKGAEDSSAVILGSRIAAMDQFIYKLQMENKLREKERNEAQKELMKKEQEISALRAKVAIVERKGINTMEEEINLKANQQVQELKTELEKRMQECQKMADDFVEKEKRKMENMVLQFQQEAEMLRQRLKEIELELCNSQVGGGSLDMDGSNFVRKLLDTYSEDPGMVKSMDLDKSYDLDAGKQDVAVCKAGNTESKSILDFDSRKDSRGEDYDDVLVRSFPTKACLSTVFEEDEEEESGDDKGKFLDEEVQKEVIEEKKVCSSTLAAKSLILVSSPEVSSQHQENVESFRDTSVEKLFHSGSLNEPENAKDTSSSMRLRIQNIFTLCGNHRELSQHIRTPMTAQKRSENIDPMESPTRTIEEKPAVELFTDVKQLQKSLSRDFVASDNSGNNQTPPTGNKKISALSSIENIFETKENYDPIDGKHGDLDVYVKWEASMENPGKFITTLKVVKDSTLADLRKLIEIHLGRDDQAFTFLVLGDPSGAPVPRDEESKMQALKLPICNNQRPGRLACLRPLKGIRHTPLHIPLSPLENKLPLTPISNATKIAT